MLRKTKALEELQLVKVYLKSRADTKISNYSLTKNSKISTSQKLEGYPKIRVRVYARTLIFGLLLVIS
jgi:hypothetical protein